jgi:putative sigma-54 modulation protein
MEDCIMNIRINSVKFDADQKLEDFIEGKVMKLTHFADDILGAEVFLKVGNNQNLENKISEIKLDIPGNDLFAKKKGKSFEESTDNAIEALLRQIKKRKGKLRKN